jgi:hypothetical protein
MLRYRLLPVSGREAIALTFYLRLTASGHRRAELLQLCGDDSAVVEVTGVVARTNAGCACCACMRLLHLSRLLLLQAAPLAFSSTPALIPTYPPLSLGSATILLLLHLLRVCYIAAAPPTVIASGLLSHSSPPPSLRR